MFKKTLIVLAIINAAVFLACDAVYQSQKATNDWAPIIFFAFSICMFFSITTLAIIGFVTLLTNRAARATAQAKLTNKKK